MNKKIISFLLSLFLIFNISTIAFASKDLDESKDKFNQVSSSIKEIDNEIANLTDEINSLEKNIKDNENKITDVEKEISFTESKVKTLQEEISEGEEILSKRIREMYKSGSYSNLELVSFIFEAESLSDLFDRIYASQTMIKMDKKLIEENKTKVTILNKSIDTIKEKKASLQAINEDINKSLSEVKEKSKEVSNKRLELTTQRDNLSEEIKENEENLIAHQISIVYSSNPTAAQLNDAILNLKGLLPQISTSSVKSKINSAISEAKYKLSLIPKDDSNSSENNNSGDYKATYTMEATAYYGHTITAMGTVPVRDPNGLSTVAVDPTVIPLGSKVLVPGYGYAIAADTGGAIKGMKIDLFMNTREECYSFGRRKVTVHLIAYPGEW